MTSLQQRPTIEIQQQDWSTFFANLMRRHAGGAVRMEVMAPGLGAFVVGSGVPLSGIEADIRHHQPVVSVLMGETSGPHVSHLITTPLRVLLLEEGSDEPTVFEVESGEGLTSRFTIG